MRQFSPLLVDNESFVMPLKSPLRHSMDDCSLKICILLPTRLVKKRRVLGKNPHILKTLSNCDYCHMRAIYLSCYEWIISLQSLLETSSLVEGFKSIQHILRVVVKCHFVNIFLLKFKWNLMFCEAASGSNSVPWLLVQWEARGSDSKEEMPVRLHSDIFRHHFPMFSWLLTGCVYSEQINSTSHVQPLQVRLPVHEKALRRGSTFNTLVLRFIRQLVLCMWILDMSLFHHLQALYRPVLIHRAGIREEEIRREWFKTNMIICRRHLRL